MLKQFEVQNIYIGEYVEPIYKGEYIEYKMDADALGALYIPVCGFTSSGSQGASYNWKISIDGGAEVTESGTGGTQTSISYTGYTAGSNHTIKITPVSESYGWARAYCWFGLSKRTLLTEIVYDSSYMGYAVSATDTGAYYRYGLYRGCTSLIKSAEEYLPDTVTTIGIQFRQIEYDGCTSLTYACEEILPDSVTSIGDYFRSQQYRGCTALTEIKGWKDLSIGTINYYRYWQYYNCTSNKTVKVLSDVGDDSFDQSTLDNSYVTSVSVPSAYLTNFKNTTNQPWYNITDSKFIGY